MAVYRIEKTKNYTVMSNYHLRSKDLSLKAKGLLSMILSLPDDWNYTLAGLASICKEGVDSIRSAVKELESYGYITRSRIRNEKGQLTASEYTIHEMPVAVAKDNNRAETVTERSASENSADKSDEPIFAPPAFDEPMQQNPTLAKATQLNKDIPNKDLQNTDVLNIQSIPIREPENKFLGFGNRKRKERCANMYEYRKLIKQNIEYDVLVQSYSKDKINELVDILTETVCSSRKYIRAAGVDYPAEAVKSKLLKLNYDHICYALDCLNENTTKIRNIRQYLLTVMFNAPSTMSNCYSARVRYDMYGTVRDYE